MSLSPAKRAVLETLFMSGSPAKPARIAAETEAQLNSTMMHLIWLVRGGYAIAPEKGQYKITDKGKNALGIPETTPEVAKSILAQTRKETAFHFYVDVEKPLSLYAYGIRDFSEKIPKVPAQSLEFHIKRGDFEKWFECLGDLELSKRLALLREKKLAGESLCKALQDIVGSRCTELSSLYR